MSKTIFISLPVADLAASIAFYRPLGFEPNPTVSDETAAAMVWSESIHVMLLTHARWRTFTQRPPPPDGTIGLMLSLSMDSRDAVDATNRAAAAHGGRGEPARGSGLHVKPRPRRSRRASVGDRLDGSHGGCGAGLTGVRRRSAPTRPDRGIVGCAIQDGPAVVARRSRPARILPCPTAA